MQKKDDIVKIYDDMFNLIGAEKWSVVHEQGLLHQVVHLWMYGDEADERWLYFIQRSKDLDVFPGLYDLPVSGHIDPEETFSHAVVTLTKERLGLKLLPEYLKHVGNIRQIIDSDNYHDNAFCHIYVNDLNFQFLNLKSTVQRCFLRPDTMSSANGLNVLKVNFRFIRQQVNLLKIRWKPTGGGLAKMNLQRS